MATWTGYMCADCGWTWPLFTPPPDGAECGACGGELEQYETEED